MQYFSLDRGKTVPLKREPGTRYPEVTFGPNEAWAVEVALTTGDGKPHDSEARTTVFRRAVEVAYTLKNKSSQKLLSAVNQKFPTLPFSLRNLPIEERDARLGVIEAVRGVRAPRAPAHEFKRPPTPFPTRRSSTVLSRRTPCSRRRRAR